MTGEEVSQHFVARRYEEVVTRLLSEGNTDETDEERRQEFAYRAMSQAYLRLGNYTEAIRCVKLAVSASRWSGANDFCEWGAAHWIGGQTSSAVKRWREASKCNYGDSAGNITPWLLLYYAGVRLASSDARQEAIVEIRTKLNTGWSKNWPAPLGRLLIGIADETNVQAVLEREHPVRRPDERCKYDFYRGVKQAESGDHKAAMSCFRNAVDVVEQRTWTTEFVLASHEVEGVSNSNGLAE